MFSRAPDAFMFQCKNNLNFRRQDCTPRHVIQSVNRRSYVVKRSKNNPKHVFKYKNTPSAINIVGYSRIRSSDHWFVTRTIWFCVLLACFGCFIWQVWDCTKNFYDQPIYRVVEVTRNSKIQFPAVYVCSGFMRDFLSSFLKDSVQKCSNDGSCFNDPLNRIMFLSYLNSIVHMKTADQAWTLGHRAQIRLFRPCLKMNVNCTATHFEWKIDRQPIKSFWGGCNAFNTVISDDYRGPYTYFNLMYERGYFGPLMAMLKSQLANSTNQEVRKRLLRSRNRDRVGLLIYFYQKFNTKMSHFMFFKAHKLLQGFKTHVEIHKTVFKRVNRRLKKCSQSENEVFDCFNQCIEKKMSKTCRMPYISNTGSQTSACLLQHDRYNYVDVHLENYEVYSNFSVRNCNCSPACEEISFTPSIDVVEKLSNRSNMEIKFYYGTNIFETTTEKLAYGFSAYLSNIGGNLGYFLGGCILNILEIIEYFVHILRKRK